MVLNLKKIMQNLTFSIIFENISSIYDKYEFLYGKKYCIEAFNHVINSYSYSIYYLYFDNQF